MENTDLHIKNNNNKIISINVTETIIVNYVNYEILDVKVVPFNSCTVSIILSTDNDQKRIMNFTMSLEDYSKWNNDDNYLINWINTKLSLLK